MEAFEVIENVQKREHSERDPAIRRYIPAIMLQYFDKFEDNDVCSEIHFSAWKALLQLCLQREIQLGVLE